MVLSRPYACCRRLTYTDLLFSLWLLLLLAVVVIVVGCGCGVGAVDVVLVLCMWRLQVFQVLRITSRHHTSILRLDGGVDLKYRDDAVGSDGCRLLQLYSTLYYCRLILVFLLVGC